METSIRFGKQPQTDRRKAPTCAGTTELGSWHVCYLPQRSCSKVTFLHLSVSHSDYGGRGSLSQHAPHVTWPGGLCPGGLCPGGSLSMGVSVQGGSLSRGVSVCRVPVQGVSVWGVSVQGSPSGRPSRTVTRVWCASYWNAFLFPTWDHGGQSFHGDSSVDSVFRGQRVAHGSRISDVVSTRVQHRCNNCCHHGTESSGTDPRYTKLD